MIANGCFYVFFFFFLSPFVSAVTSNGAVAISANASSRETGLFYLLGRNFTRHVVVLKVELIRQAAGCGGWFSRKAATSPAAGS